MSENDWWSRANTFVYHRIHSTSKEWMAYGRAWFGVMKQTPYYRKHIAELPEGTMLVKLQQGRYDTMVYGGQQH